MGSASAANKDSLLLGSALLVPVGGSPAGTGGSPVLPILQTRSKSVFGNCVLGSTGHWPVPSGDSPDGMGSASAANKDSLLLGSALLVPVGGSPTGTGESPMLPIFKTCSKSVFGNCVLGGTGHLPVPSGDSPDGMGCAAAANKEGLLLGAALLVPAVGWPPAMGAAPRLPVVKQGTNIVVGD